LFQGFVPHLKEHLLHRLDPDKFWTNETLITAHKRNMVTFVNNRIFKHKVMRINYTTYDLRRAQDSLNSCTHADFMTLPCDIHSGSTNDDFPYQFGRIIGIFHAMVLYNGTGLQLSKLQHMEFLFVRWFTIDQRYRGGWKSKRLHQIRFVNGDDDTAFGFLDP
jgi:hypothetical protein